MPKLVMRFILIIVFFYSICSFGQSSSNMSWTKNVGTRKFPASKTIFRVFKVFDATSDDCLKFPLPLHLKIVAYGGKTVM